MNIIIYTRNMCAYCDFAKKLLQSKKLEYTEINVESAQNPNQALQQMQKEGKGRTFPQIIVDGVGIGGYNELVLYLDQHGG